MPTVRTARTVKRAWTLFKSADNAIEPADKVLYEEFNHLVDDFNAEHVCNRIVPGFPAGLDIDDGNAENVETNAITYVYYNGVVVAIAVDAELDTSVGVTASSDVDTNDKGALWIYADAEAPTVCTCEASHPGATSGETTAVGALRWLDADHYQRNAGEVPIAVVTLTEGGSGAFTWGADSISAETEAFVDFVGSPGVVTEVADIIVTAGASSTTWAHGAGAVVLGDGSFVALTAQTALPVNNATAIANGAFGAFMLYVLSDGGAEALQIDADATTHDAALLECETEVGNPYLACIGYLIVENRSGSSFTPGTSDFNGSGITTTVYTLPAGPRYNTAKLSTVESQDR